MPYLEDGTLVDTYGGDETWWDLWYEIENGEYLFYEMYYGAKPQKTERITDPERIKELMKQIQND